MEEFSEVVKLNEAFTPAHVDQVMVDIITAADPLGFLEKASEELPENLWAAYRELQDHILAITHDETAVRDASLGFLVAHKVAQECVPGYQETALLSTFLRIQVRRSMLAYQTSGEKPVHFAEVEGLLQPYPGVYTHLIEHHFSNKAAGFGAQVALQCISPLTDREQ